MNAAKTSLFESAKPLKLGFIGGALQSAVGYAHFVASSMDNMFEVVAGCFSQQSAKNLETAEAYGVDITRLYGSLQTMLKREQGKLDAIVVLTPTPAHFECVRACLEAGFAVICEKSLATNSEEAKQLQALCKKYHGFLVVTYNYSGYPMVRELAQQIKQESLGKLLHFQIEMPQEGFIRVDAEGKRPQPQAWRLQDGAIPTLHLDLAVHLHQMVYYLTGEKPVELVADQSHYGWFDGVIDNVSCLCRYTNNIQGQVWFSKSALGYRNGMRIRIFGTKASAEWVQTNPEELLISHNNGRREILDRASPVSVTHLRRYNRFKSGHPAGFIEAFANLYLDIADCIRQFKITGDWGSSEVFGSELAIEGLHFLEAIETSVRDKCWVNVQNQNPRVVRKETVGKKLEERKLLKQQSANDDQSNSVRRSTHKSLVNR